MGWIGLILGTVVKVHDDDHQLVRASEPALGAFTDLVRGHFVILLHCHIASFPGTEAMD
jgi:hypothetical protein